MAGDSRDAGAGFLRRWSQRKLAAARESTPDAPLTAGVATPPVAAGTRPVSSDGVAATTGTPPPAVLAAAAPAAGDDAAPLPSIDTLDFDADFTRFLAPKVDETVRRQALRKLFSDPRFNVMDGLDVYIDDYSKFEPIAPDVVAQLRHARHIFNPPQTRVNESGYVEDIPDEAPDASAAAEADAAHEPANAAAPASGTVDRADEPVAVGASLADPGPAGVPPDGDATRIADRAPEAAPAAAADAASRRIPAQRSDDDDRR